MIRLKVFRHSYSCIIALLFIAFSALSSDSDWSPELYSQHTPVTFKDFKPANEKIDPENPDLELLEAAVFFETNLMRIRYELPLLEYNPSLEKAARSHSQDMATMKFFNHFHPVDEKRKTPEMRMDLAGIKKGYRAENIAFAFGINYRGKEKVLPPRKKGEPIRNFETRKPYEYLTYNGLAEIIVDGWMANPGHRDNILDKRYRLIGIGAGFRLEENFFRMAAFTVTADFASPQNVASDK